MANNEETKLVITNGPSKFDLFHAFASSGLGEPIKPLFEISGRRDRSRRKLYGEILLLSPVSGYEGHEWTLVMLSNETEQSELGMGDFMHVFYSTATRKGKLRELTSEEEKLLQGLRMIF